MKGRLVNRICLPAKVLLLGAVLLAAGVAHADPIHVQFCRPTLDRWMYPYNSTPGCKSDLPVFGGLTTDGVFDDSFDNRDGQMLIGFNTSAPEPAPELCAPADPPCEPAVLPVGAGLGPDNYYVTWARVTVTVLSDLTFTYDPTPDPWQSWLLPGDPDYVPDRDPGRPVELFGTAFRHGWSASTFPENGPFCNNCDCLSQGFVCKYVRSAFPTDAATCGVRDISNNVDGQFDPIPFAVGTNDTLTPGQFVPYGTELTFDIDINDDCIQDYLRAGLDEGMLDFVIASIFPAEQQQAGTYPTFFAKEDLLVRLGIVEATRLDMTVLPGPHGDVDGDGIVGIADFLAILGLWGPCDEPCPPTCLGDLDGDCFIGIIDFLIVIGNWTLQPR